MIAVDWGTSSFRAYRLSAEGRVLEKREAAKGILGVAPGQFPQVLQEQVRDWIAAGVAPIVMSGMVGSRQGWVEVPYVQCPASLDRVSSRLEKVSWDGLEAWIVPGLSCVDPSGVPDVMRGEETQLLGAMSALPAQALVCLPGTHSKWVQVKDGRIERFATHMTGELFSVLRQHSLLGRMMKEGALDLTAFVEGVSRSGDDGGLLHHLFGVRTRGLFGELTPPASASYLSGLLIGYELRSADAGEMFLLGAPDVAGAYRQAAELLGIQCRELDADAAARGLFELGRKIGV